MPYGDGGNALSTYLDVQDVPGKYLLRSALEPISQRRRINSLEEPAQRNQLVPSFGGGDGTRNIPGARFVGPYDAGRAALV